MQQVSHLHPQFDKLQALYGDVNLMPIYGAGEIYSPKAMFIFMNPTGRNISSNPEWKGLRAPWLGTKQVWRLFSELGLLNEDLFTRISSLTPNEWQIEFAQEVYSDIAANSAYITNLAKCTQADARPLSNKVFHDYLDLMYEEVQSIQPQKIITFGNQVSSLFLKQPVKVSDFTGRKLVEYDINGSLYQVFPTYYPVGQGSRNLPLAVSRIKDVLNS